MDFDLIQSGVNVRPNW